MKGHGREMIQFGIPVADPSPEDEVAAGASKGMFCSKHANQACFFIPIPVLSVHVSC